MDDEEIAKMLAEGKGPINFQIFLGMYGDKISGEHQDIQRFFNNFQLNNNLILELRYMCFLVRTKLVGAKKLVQNYFLVS